MGKASAQQWLFHLSSSLSGIALFLWSINFSEPHLLFWCGMGIFI